MAKKGVELSLNVIIIASIGLLILVILAYLVITGVTPIGRAPERCSIKYAGACSDTCDGEIVSAKTDCDENTNGKTICCKKVNIGT